jgi:mutator protein MutT
MRVPTRVAAAVIEENGRVLIARRKSGDRFGGLWEFPGGKVEAGESPVEALEREIREELAIEIAVGDLICAFPFKTGEADFELMAFRTIRLSGAVACLDHEEIRWVDPGDLAAFTLTEPDRRVVSFLYATAEKRGE